MKKIILFSTAILALGFASCKKDYTCTCTSAGSSTATVTKLIGVSKKTAKANCVSTITTGTGASAGLAYVETCTLAK